MAHAPLLPLTMSQKIGLQDKKKILFKQITKLAIQYFNLIIQKYFFVIHTTFPSCRTLKTQSCVLDELYSVQKSTPIF